MSNATVSDGDRADALRTLADRVEALDDEDAWEAFGEDMDNRMRANTPDEGYAGFRIDAVPWRAEMADRVHIVYRQFGDSPDGLRDGAMAEAADAYPVVSLHPSNPVQAYRHAVANALRDAADD